MANTQKTLIPIEALADFPAPGMNAPHAFRFRQDDRLLMYLFAAEGGVQQVYGLDIETGEIQILIAPPGEGISEDDLSPEEVLRRQRLRLLATGITIYQSVKNSQRILVPIMGNLYIYEGSDQPLREVYSVGDNPTVQNPRLSRDGTLIAYVQDAEVYVLAVDGGDSQQITQGARGTGKTNGLAEYIAQEELARYDGYWWSPDNRHIAYTEVDETHIPAYRIMHQGKATTGEHAQEDHRYPFAGEANAIVRLAVVPVDGGEPVWMDLDYDKEIYIARVFWWSADRLGAEILNREQTMVDLVAFDITIGDRTSILRETSSVWINRYDRPMTILNDGSFVWTSERSGFNHLYLYAANGELVRQLTDGEWMVDEIISVDRKNRQVYFEGNRQHPTERHLYSVSLDGAEICQITSEPGMHNTTIDHGHRHFVDVHDSLDTPPTVTLRSLADGAVVQTIHHPADPRLETYDLQAPELVSLENRVGVTLYGALFRPPERFGPGPYPTVIHVYGGPHPQLVANQWRVTSALMLQYLREQGFLVFRLDNRGSARRGLEFEGAIKNRMGTVELDDQVDGVHWLVERGLADPERIGIHGYSYGGYMTLMGLAKAPDVFKVGVSGAPVTAWDGYDTCYTERYMGTPQSNPEGYAEGSPLNFVDNITGKLLLIHGMLDENVHFRHTARLINALMEARKAYDLLIFPDERHMPRHKAGRTYMNEHIVGYFQKYL